MYTPDHGDIYALEDRKQLGFTLNGVKYSVQPNGWYIAGESIQKGMAVSVGNASYASLIGTGSAGNVYISKDGITEKTVGIALNTAALGEIVETSDRGIYQWPNYYTVAWSSTTGGTFSINDGTNTVVYTPDASGSSSLLIDNIITSYNLNPRPNIELYKVSSTVLAMFWIGIGIGIGSPIPVLTSSITGATLTLSTVFQTSDIGNTVYINPVDNPVLPSSQFTTDRNFAISQGNPPIEVGIVIDTNTLFIDFEGDSRGASNLSQISGVTGEAIVTSNIPKLVSRGTDGNIYLADCRKSLIDTKNRQNPIGFVISGTGFSTTISSGTNVVIQTLGVFSGISGLTSGKWVYLNQDGGITQDFSSLSSYTDVITTVGVALSSTQIFANIDDNSFVQFYDPLYKVDTDWVTYPNIPAIASSSSGSPATGGSITFPLYLSGTTPEIYDLHVDVYVKDGSNNQRKITDGIIGTNYGYQISASSADTVTISFGTSGIAYYSGGSYTAIDGTYTYRIIIYRTEKYNKHYDYTLDQWINQYIDLGLVDFSIPVTTQGSGRFDIGATNPSATTLRLNYSGNYWASTLNSTGEVISHGNLVVLRNSGFNGSVSSSTLSNNRSWTFPDTPGEILVAGASQVNGYFDRGPTAPSSTIRLNYNGNLYITNIVVSTDISTTNGNIVSGLGLKANGSALNPGYFTKSVSSGRPSVTDRVTFSGNLVSSYLETRTLFGDVVNSLNENGSFALQDQAGVLPTNWVLYQNSVASGVPTLGSIIAAPGPFTFSTIAGGPLGHYSSGLVKDAANNRQGCGVYTTVNLPASLSRSGRWLKISFDYRVTSGVYTNGDVQIFLVPAGGTPSTSPIQNSIPNSTNGTTFTSYFLTDATTIDYKLCFHVVSTTTNGFTLEIARVSVGVTEQNKTTLMGAVSPSTNSAPYLIIDGNHPAGVSYSPASGKVYIQYGSSGSTFFGGKVRIGTNDDSDAFKFKVVGTSSFSNDVTALAKIIATGDVSTEGQLKSTIADGTPPLVVSSTTKVVNLNSDLFDGATLDTDVALTANSDTRVASQKAVKAYVDSVAVINLTNYIDNSISAVNDELDTKQYILPIGAFLMYDAAGWVDSHPTLHTGGTIPGWYACIPANSIHGAPDLTNSFIRGTSQTSVAGYSSLTSEQKKEAVGNVTLDTGNLPSHYHNMEHKHSTDVNTHHHGTNNGGAGSDGNNNEQNSTDNSHSHTTVNMLDLTTSTPITTTSTVGLGNPVALDLQYAVIYIRRCY